MANEIQRRNDLFGDIFDMRNWMNDSFFSKMANNDGHMRTDIAENEKNYRVKGDMPGFQRKNIHINYANNILTITGARDTFDDVSDKDGNILHSERRYGQMSREFRLPDVDINDASAKYEDGVLILTLPKLDAINDSDTHIEIE